MRWGKVIVFWKYSASTLSSVNLNHVDSSLFRKGAQEHFLDDEPEISSQLRVAERALNLIKVVDLNASNQILDDVRLVRI